MRAYTSMCLVMPWLLGLLACADETEPDQGAPTQNEEVQPDAGPTNCSLQGTWDVALTTQEHCAPTSQGSNIVLTVDDSPGADDFQTGESEPQSTCGEPKHAVTVAADGCTVTTTSLSEWCANSEPQCNDYQLILHAQEDGTAFVDGTYRQCWCNSPSAFGTKVDVVGHAVRR